MQSPAHDVAGDVPRRDGGWVTLVNRLKAVLPHFVAHVKAPAPNITMRRLATSERTLTPALGAIRRTIKSSTTGVQVFIAALAELRNPPAPLGERSRMRPSTPAVAKKALDSHPQLKGRLSFDPERWMGIVDAGLP